MEKVQGFILYKIYYGKDIVYLGRTKQPLQDRIRGHLFKKPMQRNIDIHLVTKIEYAEFKTEADMNLYEIYFINLWKPILNVDDKCKDDLTISLPNVEWKEFKSHLWGKWEKEITDRDNTSFLINEEEKRKFNLKTEIYRKFKNNEISFDEYYTSLQKVIGFD